LSSRPSPASSALTTSRRRRPSAAIRSRRATTRPSRRNCHWPISLRSSR
jgi:hypothetical protein